MIEVKPFAAFDVDGTIFKSSLLEKIIEECIDAGIFRAEPFNTAYATRREWQKNNSEGVYQAYLNQLVQAFAQEMAGVPVESFLKSTESMLQKNRDRMLGFPRKLLREIEGSHYRIALSGSPEILVAPFLEGLGFDEALGTKYDIENERFTGSFQTVGDKAAKLAQMAEKETITKQRSIAVGDTISDIPMLGLAERPVMFNPSRTLTHYGRVFNWPRVIEVKDQITVLERDETGHYSESDLGNFLIRLRRME